MSEPHTDALWYATGDTGGPDDPLVPGWQEFTAARERFLAAVSPGTESVPQLASPRVARSPQGDACKGT